MSTKWISEFLAYDFSISAVAIVICSIAAVWLLRQRRGTRNIRRRMHIAFMESIKKRLENGGTIDSSDISWRNQNRPQRELSKKSVKEECSNGSESESKENQKLKIFYCTQTGVARRFAYALRELCCNSNVDVVIQDIKNYDPEESLHKEVQLCIFIVSTYVEGGPPESGRWFHKWLSEAAFDFRVGASHLQGLRFAVVGLGNSYYKEDFNRVGKEIDSWLAKLSAKRVMRVGLLDENTTSSKYGGLDEDFEAWCSNFKSQVLSKFESISQSCCGGGDSETCACDNKVSEGQPASDCCSKEKSENLDANGELESSDNSNDDTSDQGDLENGELGDGLVDLEDLGTFIHDAKKSKQITGRREMITPALRKSLEKQGYRLLGTHSGVKMCRWTKSMLRGRGGCYKHSFYGIASHQCMEATPSLACANKCVFCWRHHTNPVGTEWKWKTDPPEKIFQEALDAHRGLVRQFRGVPGVKEDRFQEGLNVQHCALSLVGEPIMYPHINQLVELLHGKGISTFLVTNAQFPDAIRQLNPVTQLYVSVDASTKDSLKKIDRPLFRDFWERLLDSLKALSEKGQRTVYRLTLVKSWNTDELAGYVKLVDIGRPDFIEVKGVTFCGDSKASSLTMKNVPWHEEVLEFCRQLNAGLEEGEYEIACEHEHSNCVLIASTKFKVNGIWYTWIDYAKFHELYRQWVRSEGRATFLSTDYMAMSPSWAVLGASERGFDPVETRFRKERRKQAETTS